MSYNDVQIYDTQAKTWLDIDQNAVGGIGLQPKKRSSHASGMMGGVMLIHGGYSTEAALLLDDFCLFDVNLRKWINTITKIDGVVFEKQNKYGRFSPD